MTDKRQAVLSRGALYLAAIVWGSSFFVVKNSVDAVPPALLLALRNTIAAVLLGLIFRKRLARMTKRDFLYCLPIGIALFLAALVQTIGITDTTPGKNAFLTAIYCVLVPFLYWLALKKRPRVKSFIAAFSCLAGIGLVSLSDAFTVSFGDAMTLLSGFLFAVHILLITTVGRRVDPMVMTVTQFAITAVLCWIYSLLAEGVPVGIASGIWPGIVYLAVFSTAGGYMLQILGLQHTPPAAASLIMSLESVFGVLFSVLFYGEQVTPRLLLGFLVIFLSVIISEADLGAIFHRAKKALCRAQ